MYLKIATASINTKALDLDHNTALIEQAIAQASNEQVNILLLPELCLSGYGCEDMFFSKHFIKQCQEQLILLTSKIESSELVVAVGLPLIHKEQLYNGCAVITKNTILGIVCKQHLAKSGVHYEPRWFQSWQQNTHSYISLNQQEISIGDLLFELNGMRIGFEICEDAWHQERVAANLHKAGVDIILNPSASHFAIGKHQKRYELVIDASIKYQCIYAYTNLVGCEAGRTIYDGGNMIAQHGELLMKGERFSFHDVVFNSIVVDCQPKMHGSSVDSSCHVVQHSIKQNMKGALSESASNSSLEFEIEKIEPTVMNALALGLWDWQRKTRQKGFVVSLSGGADSALCSVAVYLAHLLAFSELGKRHYLQQLKTMGHVVSFDEAKDNFIQSSVMPLVLTTVYQASKNSGDVTENAAKVLAHGIGANFHQWRIDTEVDSFQQKIASAIGRELSWQQDDIALQNIQARVRAPGVWFLANVEQKLLIATSNLSEASVGYCTMDGDTAGVLSPIGGISKTLVLKLNEFLYNKGFDWFGKHIQIPELQAVVEQTPTAELRPNAQQDETDLMPFEVLDTIRLLSQVTFYSKSEMLAQLKEQPLQREYSDELLQSYIEKYFTLYARNQWKRERLATSFHIEQDSACPKTYRRYPVLS